MRAGAKRVSSGSVTRSAYPLALHVLSTARDLMEPSAFFAHDAILNIEMQITNHHHPLVPWLER